MRESSSLRLLENRDAGNTCANATGEGELPAFMLVPLVAIVMALGLLATSGHTAGSGTSRAAAYVTLGPARAEAFPSEIVWEE